MKEISIPTSIEKKNGDKAFLNYKLLKKSGIFSKKWTIMIYKFFSLLTDIKLPDTFSLIGRTIFENCYSLTYILILRMAENISKLAFSRWYFFSNE